MRDDNNNYDNGVDLIPEPTLIDHKVIIVTVVIVVVVGFFIMLYLIMLHPQIPPSKDLKIPIIVHLNQNDRTSIFIEEEGQVFCEITGVTQLATQAKGKYWCVVSNRFLGKEIIVKIKNSKRQVDQKLKLNLNNPLIVNINGTFSTRFQVPRKLPGLKVDLLGCEQETYRPISETVYEIANIPLDYVPLIRGLKLTFNGKSRTVRFLPSDGTRKLNEPFPEL